MGIAVDDVNHILDSLTKVIVTTKIKVYTEQFVNVNFLRLVGCSLFNSICIILT